MGDEAGPSGKWVGTLEQKESVHVPDAPDLPAGVGRTPTNQAPAAGAQAHTVLIDTPTKSASKHFVNLPTVGNELEFKVRSVSVTDRKTPVPNQTVHVEVTFTNETLRGKRPPASPHPSYQKEATVEGLTNLHTRGARISKKDPVCVWTGTVTTDGKGKGSFKVYLGRGGGEECEVRVGSTKALADDKRYFQTWRKLFVQLCHSGTKKTKWIGEKRGAFRDKMRSCYDEVFIDIVFSVAVYKPDFNKLRKSGRTGWFRGEELGSKKKRLFVALTKTPSSWQQIANVMEPSNVVPELYVNVAAVDRMLAHLDKTAAQLPLGYDQVKDGVVVTGRTLASATEKTVQLLEFKEEGFVQRARFGIMSAPSLVPKTKAELARVKDLTDSWANGEIQDITVRKPQGDDRGSLFIRLPKTVLDEMKKRKQDPAQDDLWANITVDVVLFASKSTPAGLNHGKHVVLGSEAKDNNETANTIIHEVGHAIGMCGSVEELSPNAALGIDRLPDYRVEKHPTAETEQKSKGTIDYYPEHGRWYEGRGDSGPHCAAGQAQSDYDTWRKFRSASLHKYRCPLFGRGQFFRTSSTRWCPRCRDMLNAMDVWVGNQKTYF